ncbi:MAG: tetratricopeptide repeat protein [Bryobacterales bacterium]|nr:tetratricopeptide repeat protein [Bryobacterales bacterium]
MLFSFKRAMTAIALGSLSLMTVWAQAQTKNWKDRAEYDLVQQIGKEANNQTKLDLLKQWKEKYPTSDWKDERYAQVIATYQAMGNAKGMMDTAKEQVAADPKSFTGLYYMNLLTLSMNDTSDAALDQGEKAAKSFLGIMDDFFSPARKPAAATDEQWKKERANSEAIAYKGLGWIAMNRKQYEEAHKYFVEALTRNPAEVQCAVWAGTCNVRTKKLERQGIALFFFARAAVYDGPGALPQQQRDQMKASFEKNYVNFHGDNSGMAEMVAAAKASPIPVDVKLESKDEILLKNEEELKKTNPNLALWISIKRQLSAENGAAYFGSDLKDAHIPGGAEVGGTKIEKFKAKLVSCDAPKKAKKLIVGISSPDMSEITLALETPIAVCPDKGTDIEFVGSPSEFTADPFNLTFAVENKDVVGLPAPPVAAKKGVAPAKKAAPKK